jgi:hypothetical protein
MSILKDLDPEYARLVTQATGKKREGMGLAVPTALLSLSTLLLLLALFYGPQFLPKSEVPPTSPAASTPAPITVSKIETPPTVNATKAAPPEIAPNTSAEDLTKAQSNPLLVLKEPPSAGPVKAKTAKRPVKRQKNKIARKTTPKKLAMNKSAKRQHKSPEDPPLRRDVDIITAIMR